jgi:glycine hydroxymethyltransferase
VAAGVHPSPVPYADVVTSTAHKSLRGSSGGFILCRSELAQAVDTAVFPQAQGKALMHIVAAKAVTFHEAMQPSFVDYQQAIVDNALALAAELQRLGLRLVSGGTDNHLMLIDLTATGITGQQAQQALEAAGIVANKNAIPFDTRPPAITSGIRLGTPAITTCGFGEAEMKLLAGLIVRVLGHPDDKKVCAEVRGEVEQICQRFPVPGIDD